MEGEECLAALEWDIPLHMWYRHSRRLRAKHVATIRARHMIDGALRED